MSKEISISYFKAHCLEIIKDLQISNEAIIITNRQKSVAKVCPANETTKTSLFGMFKDKAQIKSDIVTSSEVNWDAEK